MRARLLLVGCLALAGCASSAVDSSYELVETADFLSDDGSFRLELPLGWRRVDHALTLEGWDRQTITFNAGDVLDAEAGAIDASAPALQTAVREQLASQAGVTVHRVESVKLDGLDALRLHFTRTLDEDGQPTDPCEVLLFSAVSGTHLFALSLESRDPTTRPRDFAVFERLVTSFRRTDP
jgi:hypothetical protein